MLVLSMLALLVAQATGAEGQTFDLLFFVNFGILGIVFIGIVTGKLRLEREVKDREAQVDELKQKVVQQDGIIQEYQSKFEKEYIPLLQDGIRLFDKLTEQQQQHKREGTPRGD